jgi:alkylhydroperoxidase/carboxymuconolactone decarboxylase family protein YurZ
MKKQKAAPPKAYQAFGQEYPSVLKSYEAFGAACHEAGPLDASTRELVKLGITFGAGLKNAAKAHVRLARAAGVKPEAIRHAALLSATSIGFSSMMRNLQWVEEELGRR